MPGHYRSPYGYSYFNPTGKEQAALTIGSLLSGVLAASSGQSKGDAIRKGLAGTMAGYGSGYKNYQELMGDAFTRDLQTKSYGQRIKEYEETEKPYRQSIIDLRKPGKYDEEEARLNLAKKKNELALQRRELGGATPQRRDWWSYVGNVTNPETGELEGISYNAATNEYLKKPIPLSGNKEIQPKINPTIPTGETKDIADFKTLLDLSKQTKDTYDSSYSGAIQGRYSKLKENWLGGLPDDQLKFNQGLESIKNRLIYLRTGKQINEQEFKRMMEELPDVRLPDNTARVRLDNFYKMSEDLYNNRMKTLGGAGYRNVDAVQQSVSAGQPQIGGKLTVDKAKEYLIQSGGNRQKAEEMARADGLEF